MIYFDEYGSRENPTILLLHGAMAVDTFSQQYEIFKEYHLVVPHLYGAGESVCIQYEPELLKAELLQLIHSLQKLKIGVIGHSIGAQLAVILVAENPHLFSRALFLSAWVVPNEKSIDMYCKSAPLAIKFLRYKWVVKMQARYWHYTKEQANYMATYASEMKVENYRAFFKHTMNLEHFPEYFEVDIPMLAICGDRESKDMKASLKLLAQNKSCDMILLTKAGHDFPMRCSDKLNPIVERFFTKD